MSYGSLPTTSAYDSRSIQLGTSDDDVVTYAAASGAWYIGVYGTAISSYDFAATYSTVTPLTDGSPAGTTAAAYHAFEYYSFNVPLGSTDFRTTMSWIAGDPDLYLAYGRPPTINDWDQRPYWGGATDETTCEEYPIDGPWFIGVRSYVAGGSSFDILAKLNTGCTQTLATSPLARPAASQRPDPLPAGTAAEDAPTHPTLRSVTRPDPAAPPPPPPTIQTITSTVSWGTMDLTGSNPGVHRHDGSTWELRNGSGWGLLGNTDAQSVIQLASGDLLEGSNGDLFVSVYPDEGQATWTKVQGCLAGTASWDITDFLEASNGDVLVSMNGTVGAGGGVWLSGNGGYCWMLVNQGFDPTTQKIEDLVNDAGSGGTVEYYASSDGSGVYTRTITPDAYPVVTGLSSSSGSGAGGDVITVSGTGFNTTGCITGDDTDCPYAVPVVWFGGTPVQASSNTDQSITVTTPAHSAGTVDVSVMNPDTRTSSCSPPCTFAFTDPGGGAAIGPTLYLSKSAGYVMLTWSPSGNVTAMRATDTAMSTNLETTEATGSSFTDPDNVLSDGTAYYYKLSN